MTFSSDPSPSSAVASSGQKLRNLLIAIVVVVLTTALVFGIRLQNTVPTLQNLAAAAVPLDTALANGKPTFLEFYADWCTSCQTMAPDMEKLRKSYSDRLNFVMLNVDNDKWLPELLTYRVDGIPHFVYLDASGATVAEAIGEQPLEILTANIEALINATPLPFGNPSEGTLSALDSPFSGNTALEGATVDPRSHGNPL
ncbi:MAG: thioredoxin family protein [Prochlorotrichaceae cyanobacterium]|jgi:thiol-disulfide isomerase/thioredoxin